MSYENKIKMDIIEKLLKNGPYISIRRVNFLSAMREAVKYHYKNSKYYRKFLDAQNFNPDVDYKIEDIPFLPVSIFKELELATGDPKNIKKKVFSSSTTGNKPSVICLDQITIDRQRLALTQIMSDFLGSTRKVFIVFDSPSTVRSTDGEVSSRGSAIRGFLPFASHYFFVLNDDLSINSDEFRKAVLSVEKEGEICFFGFTWVIYGLLNGFKDKGLGNILRDLSNKKKLVHLGGWKKLRDLQIEKKDFNALVAEKLLMKAKDVIDIYGMTEQLGTIYPDCAYGFKHVPIYSEVLVRDTADFSSCKIGQSGFLQFLTPIPNSYPGISIISDDIGEIVGMDGCPCGRKGKYFIFKKRNEAAELKGCGDTI